ncbi:hypothetical protein N665_0351s0041 [Sinapis alba]|nr:hypothetical protein N665_0351s0041 [Sinapis alba]
MGRVFVIELERPVYTCIECHTHLGIPNDIISKKIQATLITYNFSRLFNTFLAERTSNPALQNIFCVGCADIIGMYRVKKRPPRLRFHRSKLISSTLCVFMILWFLSHRNGFINTTNKQNVGEDSMDRKEAMMRFRSCDYPLYVSQRFGETLDIPLQVDALELFIQF